MRTFGIVGSSVWRSRKFRALPSDADRLVYFYLLTSSHGNSAGVLVLPPEMAAVEMRASVDAVKDAYVAMSESGLIRYDQTEELVQIVNYYQFNTITSRKHLAGPLKIVRSMPQCWVKQAAACDLVVEIYNRAMGWDKSVEARGVFLQEAANLVRDLHLHRDLVSPRIGLPIELQIGLSIELLIDLPIQGDRNGDRNKTETETDTETETETETENRAGEISGISGLPASPLDSGRASRAMPQDLAAIVSDLKAKAYGGKG